MLRGKLSDARNPPLEHGLQKLAVARLKIVDDPQVLGAEIRSLHEPEVRSVQDVGDLSPLHVVAFAGRVVPLALLLDIGLEVAQLVHQLLVGGVRLQVGETFGTGINGDEGLVDRRDVLVQTARDGDMRELLMKAL